MWTNYKLEKSLFIVGGGFIIIFLIMLFIKYENSEIDYLEGQWKVTDLAAIDRTGTIYWSEEEYMGRSISINKGKIRRSMHFWPYYLEDNTETYEYWTNQRTLVYNWAGKAGIGNITGWYDLYRDEIVHIISFYHSKDDFENGYDPAEEYIIFEDGCVQTRYGDGWYRIERFVESRINLQKEELWGAWDIKKFISYRDDWIGNRKQLELCRTNIELFAPELANWEEAEGIDFYPKEYYGYTLLLDEGKMSLISGDKIIEEHKVQRYEEQQLDKKAYEQEKGINDELGITNEKIEVIMAEFDDKEEENILDNEIVVIDETRIIMKIQDGWFLLTR